MSRKSSLFAAAFVSLLPLNAYADDQQLSSDMLFCSLVSEFAAGVSVPDIQESWRKKQHLYLLAASYLTSPTFITSLLPEARDRRLKLITESGSSNLLTPKTTNALLTCEATFALSREIVNVRLEELLAGPKPLPPSAPISISIPGQGFRISFTAPDLTGTGRNQSDRYDYRATAGRFMLSLFVESPELYPDCTKGQSHEDNFKCFDEFALPQIKRSPFFDKSSLLITRSSEFVKVTYSINVPIRKASIRYQSTHYLFALGGKWVDLHISLAAPTPDDTSVLELFETSLKHEKDS